MAMTHARGAGKDRIKLMETMNYVVSPVAIHTADIQWRPTASRLADGTLKCQGKGLSQGETREYVVRHVTIHSALCKAEA